MKDINHSPNQGYPSLEFTRYTDMNEVLDLTYSPNRATMCPCAFDAELCLGRGKGLTPQRSLELAFLAIGTLRVLIIPQIATLIGHGLEAVLGRVLAIAYIRLSGNAVGKGILGHITREPDRGRVRQRCRIGTVDKIRSKSAFPMPGKR